MAGRLVNKRDAMATPASDESSSSVEKAEAQGDGILRETFIGNVSKCIPLPEENSGPAKKGHLQFDAAFEGGKSDTPPPTAPELFSGE